MNKIVKIVIILAAVYVGIVVVFESLLGYYQPAGEGNLVITVTQDDGSKNDRVLSLFQSEGELYLAANHWPRAFRYASFACSKAPSVGTLCTCNDGKSAKVSARSIALAKLTHLLKVATNFQCGTSRPCSDNSCKTRNSWE